MAFDIVILIMRVTNRTWPQFEIVDVYPIAKDPGAGVAINPKHALMIVRDIPRDVDSLETVHDLLLEQNLVDDEDPGTSLGRRRWRLDVGSLAPQERNAIRNDGRLEIDWTDLVPVCIRREQGALPERTIRDSDLG